MDTRLAASLAREQMNAHGLAGWGFRWDRAVRRLGCCRWRSRTITLSRRLVERAPEHVVRNTILHEIAHALVGPGHGHGPTWRAKARAIGCNGNRCYNAAEVEPVPGRWVATCPSCQRVFHRHRLKRPSARRWCIRCGELAGQLVFVRRAAA